MSIDIPTLDTERLRLRPYRLEDYEAYEAMWQEPAVVRFIGGEPFPPEECWRRFVRQIGMWQLMGFGFFAVEDRASGRYIGECGFHEMRRDVSPSITGTVEAGWGLVTAMQGRGLAEEAMRAALAWGDAQLTRPRYTALIDVDHAASQHVAGKLGFTEFARTSYHGKPVVLMERPLPLRTRT